MKGEVDQDLTPLPPAGGRSADIPTLYTWQHFWQKLAAALDGEWRTTKDIAKRANVRPLAAGLALRAAAVRNLVECRYQYQALSGKLRPYYRRNAHTPVATGGGPERPQL